MYHHVRSETVRARYSIGDETSSDISIQLEGTLALTISASGMVRFGCAVPREWAYFRALSVVLRALHLRLIYVGEVSGECVTEPAATVVPRLRLRSRSPRARY